MVLVLSPPYCYLLTFFWGGGNKFPCKLDIPDYTILSATLLTMRYNWDKVKGWMKTCIGSQITSITLSCSWPLQHQEEILVSSTFETSGLFIGTNGVPIIHTTVISGGMQYVSWNIWSSTWRMKRIVWWTMWYSLFPGKEASNNTLESYQGLSLFLLSKKR